MSGENVSTCDLVALCSQIIMCQSFADRNCCLKCLQGASIASAALRPPRQSRAQADRVEVLFSDSGYNYGFMRDGYVGMTPHSQVLHSLIEEVVVVAARLQKQ